MNKTEIYDVGRVLIKPFSQGYEFIARAGDKYISDKVVLEQIRTFHRDRKGTISQQAFNALNGAWVRAIGMGELVVSDDLVYSDVAPRFAEVKSNGDRTLLFTSGSKDLTDLLLKGKVKYDSLLTGDCGGDKVSAETYCGVARAHPKVSAFFDDKPINLVAAKEGFNMAGVNPRLYLVDRLNVVVDEIVEHLANLGVCKIRSFMEVKD